MIFMLHVWYTAAPTLVRGHLDFRMVEAIVVIDVGVDGGLEDLEASGHSDQQ